MIDPELRALLSAVQHQKTLTVPNKTSRFKGVSWDKKRGKWKAHIGINRRKITVGRFDDEESAAKARDQKAIEIFGEFASLNFITPTGDDHA